MRIALDVHAHTLRAEEGPVVRLGTVWTAPPPPPGPVDSAPPVSFLANSLGDGDGAVVGLVRLWSGDRVDSLPIRAGVHTAEWAYDRPDIRGRVRHARPRVAGHWIGQPRGNLYYAKLDLLSPL